MPESTINRAALPTHSFDWGAIKWLVSPSTTPGAMALTLIRCLIRFSAVDWVSEITAALVEQ